MRAVRIPCHYSGVQDCKNIISICLHHGQCLAVVADCGLENNRIKLSWLSGEPRSGIVRDGCVQSGGGDDVPAFPTESSLQRETDYESITLMRLRQAEERKRLAQQLAQEDAS